jgi:UDP-N-acetylglucosamine:LPS N-acetylglucosamine transferase
MSARKVMLVASSGGHLAQLFQIAGDWSPDDRRWVSFDKGNALHLLAGEDVTWAFHPTNRNLRNLLRNMRLAWAQVSADPPRAMVTTGAGVALPFALACRARKIPVIYIETMARSEKPSLTARLIYPFSDRFFVQWPTLLNQFSRAEYHGSSFDLPHAR